LIRAENSWALCRSGRRWDKNGTKMEKTIEILEGTIWGAPNFKSSLILMAHALRKKPIDELTPDELRIAFNEDIGTKFLKNRVLAVLEEDPAAGDLFEGDLLLSVMRSREFLRDEAFHKKVVKKADEVMKLELGLEVNDEILKLK
jgi:hypothetical protein